MLASTRRNQARATGDRPGPGPRHAGADGADRDHVRHLLGAVADQRPQLRPVGEPAPARRADGLRPVAADQRHRRHPLGDPRPQPGPRHVRQRRATSTATSPPAPTARYHGPEQRPATSTSRASTAGTGTLYNLTTNIPSDDPAFYGYNFTRWTLRCLLLGHDRHRARRPDARDPGRQRVQRASTRYRVFTVNIDPTDAAIPTRQPDRRPTPPRRLRNPTPGTTTTLPRPGRDRRHRHAPLHPRRPLAARLQRPGHDHQRGPRQLPVQRPREPERAWAWTRTTTRSTWRTGSWPCRAPTGR